MEQIVASRREPIQTLQFGKAFASLSMLQMLSNFSYTNSLDNVHVKIIACNIKLFVINYVLNICATISHAFKTTVGLLTPK